MTQTTDTLVVSVPDARMAADLAPLPTGVELVEWTMEEPAPAERIDLVVYPYMLSPTRLQRLAGVKTRLVQSQSIGFDNVAENLPPGHRFANATGVHETSTAELAVALVLAAQRGIPRMVAAQLEGRWAPEFSPSLADRRILVLGYGGVGKAIVSRLVPFETDVTVVAHRARTEAGIEVHEMSALAQLLPHAEIVIVTLPATEATYRLVNAEFLAALPDGALVVNVGRGPVVDTDALVDELRAERLRAALDVTDPEPLPEGHPLWQLPGVLISPHRGGASTAMVPRVTKLVRTQIDRLRGGLDPINIVLET